MPKSAITGLHGKCTFSLLKKLSSRVPSWLYHLQLHQQSVIDPMFLHLGQHSVLSQFENFTCSHRRTKCFVFCFSLMMFGPYTGLIFEPESLEKLDISILKNLFRGLRYVVIIEHHWIRAVTLKEWSLDRISISVPWGLVTNANSQAPP